MTLGNGIHAVAVHHADQSARQNLTLFRDWLDLVLDRTGMTQTELGQRSGVDERTIARLRSGDTKPLFETAWRLMAAVQDVRPELVAGLSDNLIQSLSRAVSNGLDLNHDGDLTAADLLLAAANYTTLAGQLPARVLHALADRRISNQELLLITAEAADLRDALNTLTSIVAALNDVQSRCAASLRGVG
jgi:transcriptional regulator with XRE-family HTH domain